MLNVHTCYYFILFYLFCSAEYKIILVKYNVHKDLVIILAVYTQILILATHTISEHFCKSTCTLAREKNNTSDDDDDDDDDDNYH